MFFAFCVHLMVYTGGIIEILLLLLLLFLVAIEVYDLFNEKPNDSSDEDSFYDQDA